MKRFITQLFVCLIALLGLGSNAFAQNNPETVAIKGVLVRTTPKLADIDKTTMYGKPLVQTRDENGKIRARGLRELKKELERKMKEENKRQYDEAIRNGMAAPKNQPDLPPSVNIPTSTIPVNFDGQTSPNLQPTDNNMAAGPNHIIQAVNNTSGTQFTIWNKSGAVLAGPTIFATVSGVPGDGDPIVLYDQLADRWMIGEFGGVGGTNSLIMAISATPNPTGAWNIYTFTDNTFFPDYPKWSVWHNAYYAYTNDFNNALTAYLGTTVWAFDKAAMIAGAPTAAMVKQRLNVSGPFGPYGFMGIVNLDGMTPSTQSGLFLMPNSATQLGIFEVTPNFGASTLTVSAVSTIPVNAWATSGSIPQQSGSNLGSLSPRMMFRVGYRNNGGIESIVATHTIANGTLGGVRWYELRRNAGTWGVHQQGNIFGTDGNSRWMPGIAMDACGNIALMYDVAGTGTPAAHPSIRYTGRNSSDPLNTMTLPETVIINAGTGFGGSRWGDYNTTVPDYSAAGVPANNSFWTTSQYGNQSTRIANFTLTGGCAPAPSITPGAATLVSESCVAPNGVVDPGETVTMTLCLLNVGTANTTNAIATLLPTGGVVPITASQTYGVMTAGGPAVCQDFTFSNTSSTCGGTITVSLQVQDGANNLGTHSYNITLGSPVNVLVENFDAVVAPALPVGWTTSSSGVAGTNWVTSTSGTPAPPFNSAPNAAFVPNPANISDNILQSASFVPGVGARVTFSQNFAFETGGWDGGVMEISINGGPFQDIITAGGSFVSGGYTGLISTCCGNPLGGRNAWRDANGGFTTTIVALPVSSFGQTVRIRFRMGTDDSFSAAGWRIDDVVVTQPSCCGAPCTLTCPANITVSATAGLCGANVTYPAAVTTGLCGPVTYSRASGSFFPVGTTTVNVSTASGSTCSFTVTVNDNVPPTITCPANITVANNTGLCSAVVNYALPSVVDNCPLPGTVAISQSTNNSTITTNTGISCNAGATQWWRAYNLASFPAITGPFTIRSVRFGIEVNNTGVNQTITANVYSQTGAAFPGGTRTLIGTGTVTITAAASSFYQVNLTAPPTVANTDVIVVEVSCPAGGVFPAANALGESGPTYISSTACGVPNPVTLASLGFPANHNIIDIAGTIPVIPPVLTQTAGLPSGSVFPVGTTTNTFTARDAAGNTSTCSFTVTVNDTEQPSITCPANKAITTQPGVCYGLVTNAADLTPVFADNCGVTKLTWTLSGATTGSSPATGINLVPTTTQFGLTGRTGVGVTTVTYTAADAVGNTRTCSFTVTVTDASIPVISVQPATKFVCVGSDAVFSVTATAGAGNPLTYQWQSWTGSAWANITGATASTYTIPGVSFANNTNSYRVILTGRCSDVTSAFATLYVNPLPTVNVVTSIPPALLPGQSLNISSSVSLAGGTYAWYKNGSPIGTPNSQLPVLSNLTVDDIGTYRLVYTDPNGCVGTSANVVITGLASENLWVYPVPNPGTFQVRFFNTVNENATLRVLDEKGSKVYERAVVTGLAYTRIDVVLPPAIADGSYLVELVNSAGKRVGVKKIIVRKKP